MHTWCQYSPTYSSAWLESNIYHAPFTVSTIEPPMIVSCTPGVSLFNAWPIGLVQHLCHTWPIGVIQHLCHTCPIRTIQHLCHTWPIGVTQHLCHTWPVNVIHHLYHTWLTGMIQHLGHTWMTYRRDSASGLYPFSVIRHPVGEFNDFKTRTTPP